MKISAFLLFTFLFVSSCASYKVAPPDEDQRAKQFTAPKESANLYIYRNEVFGAGVGMTVKVDGKPVGSTGSMTYILVPLAPGKHIISSHAENESSIEIVAEKEKNYFVWQEVKMGILLARTKLHQVTEKDGSLAVRSCQMIDTRVPASLPASKPEANSFR